MWFNSFKKENETSASNSGMSDIKLLKHLKKSCYKRKYQKYWKNLQNTKKVLRTAKTSDINFINIWVCDDLFFINRQNQF